MHDDEAGTAAAGVSDVREATTTPYTFEAYGRLLDRLVDADASFVSYDATVGAGDVLLRHDVDWSPRHALTMARMEADRGVTATYFFLVGLPAYNLHHRPVRRTVERIRSLGHDVALHFSTHQYWSGEPPEATLAETVRSERRVLAELAPDVADVVSFHRPPEWVLRRSFEAFPSTYEERFFADIAYRGDSNQRWRERPPFAGGVPDRLQVLVHPGLWAEEDASFEARLRDTLASRLGRTRQFMTDQFVDKRYNHAEFCEFLDAPRDP